MSYNLSHLSVLVVDDNRHMRTLIASILHSLGIKQVAEAGDAASAFSELKTRNVDIIFTDFLMEPLDGLDFARLIRTASDSPQPFVPIIMITGYTEEARVRAARDAGVTEVLCKPVTAEGLTKRLLEVVERPRPFVKTSKYTGPDRRRGAASTYNGEDRRQTRAEPVEGDGDGSTGGGDD